MFLQSYTHSACVRCNIQTHRCVNRARTTAMHISARTTEIFTPVFSHFCYILLLPLLYNMYPYVERAFNDQTVASHILPPHCMPLLHFRNTCTSNSCRACHLKLVAVQLQCVPIHAWRLHTTNKCRSSGFHHPCTTQTLHTSGMRC